jgi:hypothetical protein
MTLTKVIGQGIDSITVDSSGNVGIGTTSPYSYGKLTVEGGNGTQLVLDNAGEQYTQMYFLNNGTDKGSIWVDNSLSLFSFTARSGMAMNFYTNNSEAMRIDSSGNVGIGATSPNALLDLLATTNTIRLGRSTSSYSTIDSNSDAGSLSFNADAGNTAGGGSMTFNFAGSEAMRINSSRNLLIGTTSFAAGQDSKMIQPSQIFSSRNTTGVAGHMSFQNPNGGVGSITTSGTSTAYNTTSDYRLKENVTADWDATTRLKQLNPVRFNFIADADTTVDGFLAHEVQSVVPEAITGTHNGMRDEEYEVTPAVLDDDGNVVTPAVMGTRSVPDYQGIDQSKLVPLLVKTIQELEARIATLENA